MTASWSWVNNGSASSVHSYTYNGHAQSQICSYGNCTEPNTIYVEDDNCTVCNPPPPHVCSPSITHAEEAHPHNQYYYECGAEICPNGNNYEKIYTNTNATEWAWVGEMSSNHHQSLGHYQYRVCAYPNCLRGEYAYYLISNCIMCYPPESEKNLKVFVDDAAYAYYNSTSPFSVIVSNATTAFALRWNMQWETSISQAPAALPYNTCPISDNTECTTDQCGSSCINHHKNTTHNLSWMRLYYNAILSDMYDLFLTLTGTDMCLVHPEYGVHSTATFGAAYMNGPELTVKYAEDPSKPDLKTNSIRALQHELSHNFGCPESSGEASGPDFNESEIDEEGNTIYFCTPGQNCIMGAAFDRDNEWGNKNIWCDNCLARFNPTLH